MSNLDPELEALKQNLVDMLILVNSQLTKCKEATMNSDADLANQVLSTEKRVNALDLAIDKDCENILALYTPVATDLRFVLASLKISNDLERIGDNAEGIANLLLRVMEKAGADMITKFKLMEMFDVAISLHRSLGLLHLIYLLRFLQIQLYRPCSSLHLFHCSINSGKVSKKFVPLRLSCSMKYI